MTWLLVIGVLALMGMFYVIKRGVNATPDPTRDEIVRTIDNFVQGKGGDYDWDNFTTYPLKDPDLEQIRKACFEVSITYASRKKTEWCTSEGIAELGRIRGRITKRVW